MSRNERERPIPGAAERWQSSGEMARAALACMSEAACLVDADLGVTAFNDAFVDYHRFPSRADCARSLKNYFDAIELRDRHDAPLPEAQWPIMRALRGERASRVECRLRRRDSGETWVGSYSFAPIHDEAGAVVGAILTAHDVTAEHEARRALDLEQQRLRMVLENTGTAVWEIDLANGAIISGAPGWLTPYGYGDDEVPHSFAAWLDLVHVDDRPQVAGAMQALIAGTALSQSTEYRVRVRDGWRWMQSRAMVTQRDDEGRPRRVMGVHLDTHDRHVADETLRENERRFDAVVEATELGVWDWDIEHNGFTCNARMSDMLGYAAEDLPDRDAWTRLIHPDDWAACEDATREHLAGRQPFFHTELRLRAKDGQWRWLHTRGRVVRRDERGRAQRMIGLHLDVDERKRTEAALARSEARLRAVVENIPVGIVLRDADWRPLFVNEAFSRAMGLTAEELLKPDWVAHVAAEDRAALSRVVVDMVEGSQRERSVVFRYQPPGRDVMIRRVRTLRIDTPGADFAFLGIGEDITQEEARAAEREQMLRQMQQAQKMEAVGQLAGGIAHDFNNLLAAVVGFGELGLRRLGVDATGKLAEYLGAIVAAGERGRELVTKMLAFSRQQPSGGLQTVDARQITREVAAMLSTIVPSSIRLTVLDAAPVPPVSINSIDLHQVLVNLVVNARDAIEGHGAVTLEVGEPRVQPGHCASCHAPLDDRPYVPISVRDTGSGMDAAMVARIFEPFFTTKEIGHGSGLGLSVVHGVLHQAGGHVQVQSIPHAGTEFRLLLRTATASAASTTATDARVNSDFHGLRVLVVDDDDAVRAYTEEFLGGEGMQISAVSNGRAALERLQAEPGAYDLVFTDQTMPQMTGVELLPAARAAGLPLPFIVCSGYSDGDSRRVVADKGAVFLAKPAAPDKILAAFATALTR